MFKMKKGFGKFLGLLVALSMVIASGTYNKVSAASVTLTDITGHWAEAAIQSAVDNGYISGHGDGRFAPNDPITRGQFASMVNRAFTLSKKASLSFADMKDGSQWYYEPVQVAVGSGYMVGYEDNTFRPLNNMTWAQCITVYVNLLGYSENKSAAQNITNYSSFQNKWYAGNVGAAYSAGMLDSKVLINGSLNPDNQITRAEAAYMLSIAYSLKNGGSLPGSTTELADKFVVPANSTFGPTSGVQTVTKNVSVTGSGALLQNLDIRGNLTIETSVGDGDVYLKGVTVTGTTTILGGGPNTIRAVDTQFSTVTLNDSNGNARLLLEGNSRATTVNVNSGGTLAATGLTGTGFGTVNVSGSTSSTYPLNINANVTSLNISAYGSYVNVNGGVVGTANIASTGTSSTLNLNSSATVSTLVASANASVYGKVNQATLNTSGVYLSQTPNNLTAGSYSPATSPGSTSNTNITMSPSSFTFNSSNASGVTLTATLNSSIISSGQSVTFTSSDSSFVTLSSGSYSGQSVSVTPSGSVAYVTARLVASDALVAANYGKTVTITASYRGYTQTTNVTIGGTGSSLITFSPSSTTLNSSNYTGVTLSAILGSSIASTGQYVTFTSSDSSLVTLSASGYTGQRSVSVLPSGNTAYVTAALTSSNLLSTHSGRSVTITANYGGYSQSMVVYINAASGTSTLAASPSAITLSESSIATGVTLTATTNNVTSTSTAMTFTVADSTLATVSSGTYTGKTVSVTPSGTSASVVVKPVGDAATVAANKGRSTTLTITYGSYTQTVAITISNKAEIAGVTLSGSTNTVDLNKTITLTPTYIYTDGTKSSSYSGYPVWSVDNAYSQNIIALSSNGVYKGISYGTGKAMITVVNDSGTSHSAEYYITVKDPNRVDLTAPASITVDRISNAGGYDFNVTLKGSGTHNLTFDYVTTDFDLYYFSTYSSTGLTQITNTIERLNTTTYGSTTLKLRLIPKSNLTNSIIKITGSYTNTANPPITTQYNERAINVVLTSSPVITVDKSTITTTENVINVTISNPASNGTLIVKALEGESLVNDKVIFGNNSSASAFYSVSVTATTGTATTVPIQIKRTDKSNITLSIDYSSSDNTVSAETKKITLGSDSNPSAESPTLSSVMINNVPVTISGSLTVISDVLYLNEDDKLGSLMMYSPSAYLYVSATNDWNTATKDGKLSLDIAEYLEAPANTSRSIYIWTSTDDGNLSNEPTNKYQIRFTNIVKPGISGATVSTTTNTMFDGTNTGYSTPVANVLNSTPAGYLSYNYANDLSEAKSLTVAVTPTGKTYANAQISFNASAGTTFSITNTSATTIGITSAGLLTIPAALLNSSDNIAFTVVAGGASSKYQTASAVSQTINVNVVRYSTVSITSANAGFTISSDGIYYSVQMSGDLNGTARTYASVRPSTTTTGILDIKVAKSNTSSTTTPYSNITLSFAESGASSYKFTTNDVGATITSAGELTIPASALNATSFKDNLTTINLTIEYTNRGNVTQTYTVTVHQ